MVRRILYLSLILLSLFASTTALAQENGYKITYNININSNGAAIWYVEYRTLLISKGDFDAFENYTMQLKSVHLTEFKELMIRSVGVEAEPSDPQHASARHGHPRRMRRFDIGTYGVVR